MDKISEDILEAARKVKLLLMDCDGVLTDGRLYYSDRGEELKVFHVRDGQGLVSWHRAGFRSGIITGRKSEMLRVRSEELGIHHLIQGSDKKEEELKNIMSRENIGFEEIAYIGDDIGDKSVLNLVGFPVVVADAAPEIWAEAAYQTLEKGGLGAVRETVDLLLKSKK
ncbi:MAG: HAD hydrolase family protein [Pyrinomonadaceae bacterium]|nr:HAD hydrolase family protein [Pyrinomonadaceae bacterium]